ncbi:MAG: tagaturonate reductase [Chitinophagaceae bacterium]
MILSRDILKYINVAEVQVPHHSIFDLPEKVIQFGTGVLLRALPDYFIDKANRNGVFNGRIIVVKSTDSGEASAFEKQDNLYTLCIRGLEHGKPIEENSINSSISRVLSAKTQWETILQTAHLPHLSIIISNTTEVGIQLVKETIHQNPPSSYPAKLLAFLFERFTVFNGTAESGMIIIPTELLVDNGKKLKSIVVELATFNNLSNEFILWLKNSNSFCSSLVDRIVPGKPIPAQNKQWESTFGYEDNLMVVAEAYRLWAIEGNEQVRSVLSFAAFDEGVVIAPSIELFRELKLRMLNGTHTLSCGLAFLSGFETVKQAMNNEWMCQCISKIMMNEIAPAIPLSIDKKIYEDFGNKVMDRFRNEAIEHQWINITLQYTSKLRMRVVPVLSKHYQLHQSPPVYIATGFAAWFLFMRTVKKEGDQHFGVHAEKQYPIKDDHAAELCDYWNKHPDGTKLDTILRDTAIWGEDLDGLPGFTDAVDEKLQQMLKEGVVKTIQLIQSKKTIA